MSASSMGIKMNKKIAAKVAVGVAVPLAIVGCIYDEDIAYAVSCLAAAWFAWRATQEEN